MVFEEDGSWVIGILLPASGQQIFQRMPFFAEAGLIDQTAQLAPSQDVDNNAEQSPAGGKNHVSNEKNLGWLGYIGDYTTQLYRDYNKPL